MYHLIKKVVEKIDLESITTERKAELQVLVDYIQVKKDANHPIYLNFICTHNSRRSQFAQVWSKVAAEYYKIDINSYSSGVEVTEFNSRAVASLKRFGFNVEREGSGNAAYTIDFDFASKPIQAFSKLIADEANPKDSFAAIMTCSDADENCPIVEGCEQRIAIKYIDPKAFDDSPLERTMYDYRSFEIASEMFYIFSLIN